MTRAIDDTAAEKREEDTKKRWLDRNTSAAVSAKAAQEGAQATMQHKTHTHTHTLPLPHTRVHTHTHYTLTQTHVLNHARTHKHASA